MIKKTLLIALSVVSSLGAMDPCVSSTLSTSSLSCYAFPADFSELLVGKPEQQLQSLHAVANLIAYHVEVITFLRKASELIPEMMAYQHHRMSQGRMFKTFGFYGDSPEQWQTSRSNIAGNGMPIFSNPEAIAAYIQFVLSSGGFKKNMGTDSYWLIPAKTRAADKERFYNRCINHADGQVKLLGYVVKHADLCSNFVSCLKGYIAFLISFGRSSYAENNEYISFCLAKVSDNGAVQFAEKIPFLRDSIARACDCIDLFKNPVESVENDDCESNIFVSNDFETLPAKIAAHLAQIEPFLGAYENLYAALCSKINEIIRMQLRSKRLTLMDAGRFKKKTFPFFMSDDATGYQRNQPKAAERDWLTKLKNKNSQDQIQQAAVKDTSLAATITYERELAVVPETITSPVKKKEKDIKKVSPAQHKRNNKLSKKQQAKTDNRESHESDNDEEICVAAKNISHHEIPANPFAYDGRVDRWFAADEFTAAREYDSICYHSFSKLVDSYLFKYGIKKQRPNATRAGRMDNNYTMGGEIKWDQGERKTVVFSNSVDSQGICYHRGFDLKTVAEIIDTYQGEGFWQDDEHFPPLGLSRPVQSNQDTDGLISENDFCIKIRDSRLRLTVTLYKPSIEADSCLQKE